MNCLTNSSTWIHKIQVINEFITDICVVILWIHKCKFIQHISVIISLNSLLNSTSQIQNTELFSIFSKEYISMNSNPWNHVCEFKICTCEFIHEFIYLWIHIQIQNLNIWIHILMNGSFHIWIHIDYEFIWSYVNSYAINSWIYEFIYSCDFLIYEFICFMNSYMNSGVSRSQMGTESFKSWS